MSDPRAGEFVLGNVVIDTEGAADLLAKLVDPATVRSLDDDLLGAMAFMLSVLRSAPVDQRMEAMGMLRNRASFDGGMTWEDVWTE